MTSNRRSGPFAAFAHFLHHPAAGGAMLLGAAAIAMLWANLDAASYLHVFSIPCRIEIGTAAASSDVRTIVNDVLMALFFFTVGMEIKRELVIGELASLGRASLPAIAAVGGMLVPVAIFLAFTRGGSASAGWAVPMATDIAFCVGLLSLLGNRAPRALVVFVTAIAVFDDIAGILVIACFYGSGVDATSLGVVFGLWLALICITRWTEPSGLVYLAFGLALWLAVHGAGIHGTLAGVIVGLSVPARARQAQAASPVDRFVRMWHGPVTFVVLPLFALANSGISFGGLRSYDVASAVALGTALGLVAGKSLGVFGLTVLAVRWKLAPMPVGVSARQLFGASVITGIGFTVSLFIAALAYPEHPRFLEQSKLGIVAGSAVAAIGGYALLRWFGSARAATASPHST